MAFGERGKTAGLGDTLLTSSQDDATQEKKDISALELETLRAGTVAELTNSVSGHEKWSQRQREWIRAAAELHEAKDGMSHKDFFQRLRDRKLAKIVNQTSVVVLVSFIAMSIAGLGMGMNMDNGMMDCMFMSGHETSWCPMQIQDHVRQWKSLLVSLPLSIIMLVVVFALVGTLRMGQGGQEAMLRFRLHEHIKKRRFFVLFEYLRQAFSQGILNPKVYLASIV